MPTPLEILRTHWGYDAFRHGQEAIIDNVISGADTLALLPTGGGKSVCFQVPALCKPGMAIVISPLIALMKDQVERLNALGIPAAYINSSLPFWMIDRKIQQAVEGKLRFLYCAPERIRSEAFLGHLRKMPVNLLVVDEAHCISQWGYDFRPAYLEIRLIRAELPRIPVIALTASATPAVQEDILDKLGIPNAQVFRSGFGRPNLRYFVFQEQNVPLRVLEIARRTLGTGIVYSRTRKQTRSLAEMLRQHGITAAAYHGGMKTSERDKIQQDWLDGKVRVMVATNAFGMGIDKADVRFVLHFNLPFDLESYYQEAGRGGRDGKTALAIAFDNPVDIAEIQRWNAEKYPSWQTIRDHFEKISRYFQLPNEGAVDSWKSFDLLSLAEDSGLRARELYRSLQLLHNEGILWLNEEEDDYAYLFISADPATVLDYKKNHPGSAGLVDFLLRNLGGEAFSNEIRFLPQRWASRLGMDAEKLEKGLHQLAKHHLVEYRAPSKGPVIRFLRAAFPLSKAEMNWDKYVFLKEQSGIRLAELLRYVGTTEVCRSLMIRHYFGEEAWDPCGVCDVCIGRHKTRVSDSEFNQIMMAIFRFLEKGQINYRQALLEVPAGTPAKREKVLRYLIDHHKIRVSRMGILSLPD
jgi:ATP-dependent DNA helicase RecQ